jgi:hypothetical protein
MIGWAGELNRQRPKEAPEGMLGYNMTEGRCWGSVNGLVASLHPLKQLRGTGCDGIWVKAYGNTCPRSIVAKFAFTCCKFNMERRILIMVQRLEFTHTVAIWSQ